MTRCFPPVVLPFSGRIKRSKFSDATHEQQLCLSQRCPCRRSGAIGLIGLPGLRPGAIPLSRNFLTGEKSMLMGTYELQPCFHPSLTKILSNIELLKLLESTLNTETLCTIQIIM